MKHRIYVLVSGGIPSFYTPDNNSHDFEVIVEDTDMEEIGEKSVVREEMANLTEEEWDFASEMADKEDEEEDEDDDSNGPQ